nr:hypothetical protein [Tanacetum cinerariifolium]
MRQETMGGTSAQTRVTQLETKISTTKAVYNKELESQLKQKRSRVIIHFSDEEGPKGIGWGAKGMAEPLPSGAWYCTIIVSNSGVTILEKWTLFLSIFEKTFFDMAWCFIGIELKGYLLNDGFADLVQHAGDELILLVFSILDFINTTNGHQFTMSKRQERIGYSRANGN